MRGERIQGCDRVRETTQKLDMNRMFEWQLNVENDTMETSMCLGFMLNVRYSYITC